jgi:hypothetical protein
MMTLLNRYLATACLACCACLSASMTHAQSDLDAEAKQRAEKLAASPFRWIIMAGKVKAKAGEPGNADAAPNPQKAATDRPSRAQAPARRVPNATAAAPAVPVPPAAASPKAAEPAAAAPTTAASPAPSAATAAVPKEPSAGEEIIFELFEAEESKLLADNSVADQRGGFFLPAAWTYSENRPNPVKASFSYDEKSRLVKLTYDVPKSVGYFGGAGITAFAANEGKDLSSLVKDGRANGLLVIQLGSEVETRVKISLVSPVERKDDYSHPFFVLTLKPGVHTYGMELADFRQAPWSKTAPTIEHALAKVLAVNVEYAHGNANGLAPQGQIQVGDVRFSLRRE